jgi:hypothetical protein
MTYLKQDLPKSEYYNWNFPTLISWENYLLNKDVLFLFFTQDSIKVGTTKIAQTQIGVQLERINKIGMDTGKKILGFPIEFKDRTTDVVKFEKPSMNIKNAGISLVNATTGDSSTNIALKIDFKRIIVTYTYLSYSDIISYLGGLKSALMPLFDIITPIIILVFLLGVAGIL